MDQQRKTFESGVLRMTDTLLIERSTRELIEELKWGAFRRIGLMFIAPYRSKENNAIRRDIREAKRENAETDKYIKQYVKEAEEFAVRDLPF
jgi:hypothetical protein